MSLINCPECSAEISNQTDFCPKCGAPITYEQSNQQIYSDSTHKYCESQHAEKGSLLVKIVSGVLSVIFIIFTASNIMGSGGLLGTSYYIVKFSQFDAAAIKVDGYMHKSKSCCQKVADYLDSETTIIRVKPEGKAATNRYGQTLRYKDCFSYCPLCCY